jgi:hypothetical protein
VRLGGIYALERIARDSPDDRPTIGRSSRRSSAATPPGRRDCPASTLPPHQWARCPSCRSGPRTCRRA